MGKKGKKKAGSGGSSSGASSSGGIPSPAESSSSTGNSKPSTAGSTPRSLQQPRKQESVTNQLPKFGQRGGGDADILCHPGFQPEKDFPTLPTRGVDGVVAFQPLYQQPNNWAPHHQVRTQPHQQAKQQQRQTGQSWPMAKQPVFIPKQQHFVASTVTPAKWAKAKNWSSQAQTPYMTELPPEEKKTTIPKIAQPLIKQSLHELDYPLTKVNKIRSDITRSIHDLEICSIIPKRLECRPEKENRGRQIIVDTNHLNLDIKHKNAIIHHYDVAVEPEKPYKFYREALELVRRECYPKNYPSFDGKKNIYSFKKLPFEDDILVHKVTVHDNERGKDREVTVKIKWANTVNLSSIFEYMKIGESTNIPQDAIQALDVVLRQPSARNFCQVGRSYFTPPGEVIPLGDGLDLWYGFFQSAIIGWKPYLNIDVAHKGFPSPVGCVEAIRKFMQVKEIQPHTSLDQYCHSSFRSFIKGLKVVYVPPRVVNGQVQKRTYKVIDLGLPAKDNIFEIPDKGKTSVWKYYREEYGYNIEYVNLPTLQCGSKSRPISLPVELCKIQEGQVIMKKMNETQTRNMVRAAAVPAFERKKKIEASIRTVNFNNDPYIQEFGLSVASEFTKVPARVLDPPTLEYKEQQNVNVTSGVWRSGKFLKACNLENWYIYSVDTKTALKKLKELADKLMEVSKEVGMVIKEPKEIKTIKNPRELEHDLSNFSSAQIVFVVLADRGPITYARVKQVAELRVGVLTQCVKSRTLMKFNNSTATNILLKLNAKLNGINHSIISGHWPSFFKKPVMVVGADVTHPAPDQVNVPSVAAVAASHDPKAFLYNMIYRIQPPREEIIKDLENIMREQLMFFYKRTNYKPYAILFYRDGVSEGQFKKVIDEEVQAIRRACKKLSKEYEPHITFLVVQKRHHTRLFPGPSDAEGKNKNVPAGTVVDTEVVHPTELDFYLVSHASIQGTSRPTKYHLLCDDSNMSEDDLEEITYYLCHLFTRCTRSVSYPAPTYYAHLAAFRVRSYIDNAGINLSNLKHEEKKREIKPAFSQASPMFFV